MTETRYRLTVLAGKWDSLSEAQVIEKIRKMLEAGHLFFKVEAPEKEPV